MQKLYTIKILEQNRYMCHFNEKSTYMTYSKKFGNKCYCTFFTKEEAATLIDYIENTEPDFDKYSQPDGEIHINVYTHAQLKECTLVLEEIDKLF